MDLKEEAATQTLITLGQSCFFDKAGAAAILIVTQHKLQLSNNELNLVWTRLSTQLLDLVHFLVKCCL